MREAIIDFYNAEKAWGYLREDSGEKWFFHIANSPELKALVGVRLVGARVQFELAPPLRPRRSDQAVHLMIVPPPADSKLVPLASLAGTEGSATPKVGGGQ